MIKVLMDGIFFEFETEESFNDWVLKLSSSDVFSIIEEYDDIDISDLDAPASEQETKRYSDRPICEYCNNGPMLESDTCPVCQSGSIFT